MPQKFDLSFAQGSLARRGAITLAVLVVYCIGSWIVLPGVVPSALFNPIGRISILSLGVVPILSALVLVEIVQTAYPPLRRWAASTPANETSLNGWVVLLSLAIAGYQANGVAVALEGLESLVPAPGLAFRGAVIVTLVGATAFLVWLSSVVTRQGLGSGFLLLLAAPLLMTVPSVVLSRAYALDGGSEFGLPLTIAAFFAAASLLALTDRLSPKLLGAGQLLWPVLIAYTLAPWLLLTLLLLYPPEIFLKAIEGLKPGQPWRLVILPALTLVFYVLRARSLAQAGSTPDEAVRWLPALLVVLAVFVSELVIFLLPAPLAFDGKTVAILVVFALALIETLGLRHSSAAA